MKFGIFLPLQNPRPWASGSDTRLIAEAIEQAELADRLGYDCVWVQEHHFLEEYSHSSAPEVLLGAISQRTRDIRLGHGVMLMSPGYNHPARCAERIAMLDQISGGRVEWGTGASGTRIELEGFGLDPAVKYAQWEEGVRTAVRLLTETPFTGTTGEYVNMPARNLVPKAIQAPHPPLWMACSNREAVRAAARHGVGALTFAFVNAEEAKYWVDAYYSTFAASCQPLGRAVNPNLAMLSNFMCHRDRDTALRQGLTGAEFFAYGLGHYFRFGEHVPGRTDLWQTAQREVERPFVNRDCFNTPDGLREHYRTLEEAGVDQIILLQQAGGYAHDEVCRSLELFAAQVLPEFKAREAQRSADKARGIAAATARAEAAIPPLPAAGPITVVSANGSESGRPPMLATPATERTAGASRSAPAVPGSLDACATIADVLRFRASERPRHRALIELADDGTAARSVTYSELAAAMERCASEIARRIAPGDRVLVAGDTGIDLAVAMLAVIRAGGTVVPAPRLLPDQRTDRFELLLDAAAPELIIGDRQSLAVLAARRPALLSKARAFEDLREAASDGVLPLGAAELALIQYTSGSIQQPKGVPITHAMVLRSMADTNGAFGFTSTDRFLAVLPLYHTFGLMVHAWSSLWAGSACYLLQPLALAADPGVWLRAISEHGIAVSGAPNFAFARCAELPVTHDGAIDLSSWRLALSGGEPPQAEVIEKFVARWQPHGLVRGAVTPTYGLTEGTGMVTGQPSLVGPRVLHVDPQLLATGTLRPSSSGRAVVSNGRFARDTQAMVVDPATRTACAPGVVGELWLRGPTIATHYVADPAHVSDRFRELASAPGERYLCTGDLGAVLNGELYLTGRAHDLIIVRGENVFPDDVELIARQAAPFIPPSGAAAFGIPSDGTEAVALVIEVPDDVTDLPAKLDAIRSALARRLGVSVARLACVHAGGLPKTPIGKLKRSEARRMLLEGAFTSIGVGPTDGPEPSIELQVERIWREVLKRPHGDHHQSFFELGGDSLMAANTLALINEKFGTKLTLTQTVARFTVQAIAERLQEVRRAPTATAAPIEVARFDDFSVQVLRPEHLPDAIECLVEAFQRLPLVSALASSRAELTRFMQVVSEDAARHGLSLVLIHRPSGRLIGCGICEDYAAALGGELPDFLDRLLPGVTIQVALDEKYIASAGMPTEKTFHMNLLALDREFEGRNLPVQFIHATLEFAIDKGYGAAIVHAASLVIQAMMSENFGFVCVASQEYATYELDGVRTYPNLPRGASIMLMTRSLRDYRGRAHPGSGVSAPVSVVTAASDDEF
jgi:acyl-CoA synthetase (AMP-forming)/AMP-acid ligase II/alkanesulfonate monooxygenase SsuD/methylene tetrahydromethanopterin reductase-like flavin-dependent oxidoreductase (luciferase family)/acyl carrier protein